MATLKELRDEFEAACEAEANWLYGDGGLKAIMARRDAATRSLHAAEDPSMPCRCPVCEASVD